VHLFFFLFLLDVHLLLAFSPLFLLLALFARSPVKGNKNKKINFPEKENQPGFKLYLLEKRFFKTTMFDEPENE
jgi:hypothetical protein